MTPNETAPTFEQEVAEALLAMLDAEAKKPYDGKTPRDFFREQVAPRMAAAIEAAIGPKLIGLETNRSASYGNAILALRGYGP